MLWKCDDCIGIKIDLCHKNEMFILERIGGVKNLGSSQTFFDLL